MFLRCAEVQSSKFQDSGSLHDGLLSHSFLRSSGSKIFGFVCSSSCPMHAIIRQDCRPRLRKSTIAPITAARDFRVFER